MLMAGAFPARAKPVRRPRPQAGLPKEDKLPLAESKKSGEALASPPIFPA